jgi:surface protein
MFNNATAFNQPIGGWDVGAVTDMTGILLGATSFTSSNLDGIYDGWSALPLLQVNITFDADPCYNVTSKASRDILIDNYGWTINDGNEC